MWKISHLRVLLLGTTLIGGLISPLTAVGAETVIYSEGFEDNNGGYTVNGIAGWTWGAPAAPGPASANSGQKCWGTNSSAFGAELGDGNLDTRSITIPALTAGQVVRLRFYAYIDMYIERKRTEGDIYISADGKQTWHRLARMYDVMEGEGWHRYEFDVSEFAGSSVNFRFRAYMINAVPGLFIDDVALTVEDTPSPAKLLTLEASEDAAADASCPWVFTWDGAGFVQDNDIYSVARYAQGEMRDYYLLQKPLVAQGKRYSLEIREVESEDSWTDFMGLLAVDHHPDVAVAPDGRGNVLSYRPAHLVKPVAAISNTGSDVLAEVRDRDNSGLKAYSGDYVELDFGKVDVTAGARVLLRVKGFIEGEGEVKPFIGPPAIVVQVRDSNGLWQEVGRLNPRFDWSEGAFDLSPWLPDSSGERKIRLTSISHDIKYHEIDFVALAAGPQPKVTVTDLPLQSATLGGTDVMPLLGAADDRYVQMGTGNKFSVSFADLPQKHGQVRDFILVSEGYYVPKSDTYFIYTWDGAQWMQRDSYSFPATDSQHTFNLSSFLPDPAGEYKVRIWQDYSNWPAAIDYVKLQVGAQAGTLAAATDLRNGSSIISLVQTSDNSRLEYPRDAANKQPRNRWTEYRWSGLPANVPPSIPAGQLTVQGNTITWTYHDADGNPQAAFDMQVWTGPGGTGSCIWSPPTVTSTATSVPYGGPIMTCGVTHYVRVRLNDGISWGGWSEASFAGLCRLTATVVSDTPGKGGGAVNSSAGGIACTGTGSDPAGMEGVCFADFPPGTTVTLMQTPDANSVWGTWSLPGCGANQNCLVTMTGNIPVTATFVYAHMAKVDSSGICYDTLSDALGEAEETDTILARDVTFNESLTMADVKAITLDGGLSTSYTPPSDWTILQGILTVEKGSLTVNKLEIR